MCFPTPPFLSASFVRTGSIDSAPLPSSFFPVSSAFSAPISTAPLIRSPTGVRRRKTSELLWLPQRWGEHRTPEMGDESCYDPETEQSCRVELVVDLADRCIDSDSKFKISVCKTSVGCVKDFYFPDQTCCYPLEGDPLGTAAGVWCIINAVVGFSGNLLTLLAIPLAKKNNR